MAEAIVTLKVSPTDFDLIRRALQEAQQAAHETGRDASTGASVRQVAKQHEARLLDLQRRLK